MADRPILFSGPMVRALLEGRKTQTRRVLKPQIVCHPGMTPSFSWGKFSGLYPDDWFGYGNEIDGALPYRHGDRLWVRETCRAEELHKPPVERNATAIEQQKLGRTRVTTFDDRDGTDGVRYLANGDWIKIENTPTAGDAWVELYHYRGRGNAGIGNQVSAIHMPRWASRLTLIVTDVRVQRVQDISEADARAEGCYRQDEANPCAKPGIKGFYHTWQSLNAKRGFGWYENPWVCALSFTVHRQNIDAMQEAA